MSTFMIALALLIASTTSAKTGPSHEPELALRQIVSCAPDAIEVIVASDDGARVERRGFTMENGTLTGAWMVDVGTGDFAEVILEGVGGREPGPEVTRSSCPVSAFALSQPDLFADWTRYSVYCLTAKSNVVAPPHQAPVQYDWR